MTRYTVTWRDAASDELAELWMTASSRRAVTDAANSIDAVLAYEPASKGRQASNLTREIVAGCLRVLFQVYEEDRIVEVIKVDPSTDDSASP